MSVEARLAEARVFVGALYRSAPSDSLVEVRFLPCRPGV